MKLLMFEWGNYCQPDIVALLTLLNVPMDKFPIPHYMNFDDENLYHNIDKTIKNGDYDAAFSINFYPLLAQVCYDNNLKYVSWSCDNPLNITYGENTLAYPTNYAFMFDKLQVESYKKKGFDTVYHLPLAVNMIRIDLIKRTPEEIAAYESEISFVGSLHKSSLQEQIKDFTPYHQGYLKALVNAQSKIYGCYFLPQTLTEQFMTEINEQKIARGENPLFPNMLSFSLAMQITNNERITLLRELSKRHQLKFYSTESAELLPDVIPMGPINYWFQMPQMFQSSKINLNITLKAMESGIPLRCMDIIGSRSFLLSNYQPELNEYFGEDRGVVMYHSIEDAIEKADFYLKHDDLRQQIIDTGYEILKENFDYQKQLKTMWAIAGLSY